MSLILEALRKSEAERRRGQTPDLFAAMPSTAPPRRRIPYWPGVLVGVVVIGGLIGQWLRSSPSLIETVSVLPVSPEPLRLTPRRIADPRVGAKTSSLVGTLNSTKPEPALAPTPSEASNVAAPAPTIEADVEPPPLESKPLGATDNASVEAAPASIATLSSSERSALPPLKLSMHVWAEEPGKRFAILDGERVIEGSMLSGAVVAQIRRDGLVLDIGGRRLWLPRP